MPVWFDDGGGRRHVLPYYHVLSVRVKGRWLDRDVVDVFASEFQHHDRAYFEAALADGRLRIEQHQKSAARKRDRGEGEHVNSAAAVDVVKSSPASRILGQGDVVHHCIHKHELSVFSGAVPVVESLCLEEGAPFYGIMAINKPVSLPTHSSGRYHYNTCLSMLNTYLSSEAGQRATRGETSRNLAENTTASLDDAAAGTTAGIVPIEGIIQWSPAVPMKAREALAHLARRSWGDGEGRTKHPAGTKRPPPRLIEARACHRLDKVTSGILICALTSEAAHAIGDLLAQKTKSVEAVALARAEAKQECASAPMFSQSDLDSFDILKTYVARVKGCLPVPDTSDRSIGGSTAGSAALQRLPHVQEADWIIDTPLEVLERWKEDGGGDVSITTNGSASDEQQLACNNGAAAASTEKQHAVTLVKRLAYDAVTDESLVQCFPLTGRTHQIRRHLALVGFPIVNDATYGPTTALEQHVSPLFYDVAALPRSVEDAATAAGITLHDPNCYECTKRLPVSLSGDARSIIHLHAWRYRISLGAIKKDETTFNESTDVTTARKGDQTREFVAALPYWAAAFHIQ